MSTFTERSASSLTTVDAPYRFYAKRARAGALPQAPDGLTIRLWRPSWRATPPDVIRNGVNWTWWLAHNLRVFRNRDFHVVLIEREGRLVHRSGVFPRYFRFPFMERGDLQIGDTWTDPGERGKGLAGLAIRTTLAAFGGSGRRFWYVVDDDNTPSIRVIEREAFALAGRGARLPRFGLRPIGYFAMTKPEPGGNQ